MKGPKDFCFFAGISTGLFTCQENNQENMQISNLKKNSFSPTDVLIECQIPQSQRQHGFPAEHEIRKVSGWQEDSCIVGSAWCLPQAQNEYETTNKLTWNCYTFFILLCQLTEYFEDNQCRILHETLSFTTSWLLKDHFVLLYLDSPVRDDNTALIEIITEITLLYRSEIMQGKTGKISDRIWTSTG